MKRTTHPSTLLVLLAWTLLQAGDLGAQDEQLGALLAARREQVELESVQAELTRSEELAEHGLVSAADLERRRVDVATARLDLQRSLLALVDREPVLTADRALKELTADGRQILSLTLRNRTPDLTESQRALVREVGGDELTNNLSDVRTDAAFVAIQANGESGMDRLAPTADGTSQRTTIALPYEAQLPSLARGEAAELRFQLLRDVSSVVVAIRHPRGDRALAIELEQADTEDVASFFSTQHSLESDLGSSATFTLVLERASVEPRTFSLHTAGLPAVVDARFVEASGSRISRIHFPAGVKRQGLGLEIFLPERQAENLVLDQPLSFWVIAADERDTAFEPATVSSQEAIEASTAAHLALAIVPRGVPELEVRASSLFEQIDAGEHARTELRLRNTGSRRLDQIALRADAPPGWRLRLEPADLDALTTGAEATVVLTAEPPAEVESGEFELRLITETLANNRPVPVSDKVFRIRIEPRANLLAGILTSGLFLLVIAATVIFGLRLVRR